MALSKAFRFMQTNRGVALSDCRRAQARTRFTPRQRFAKAKLCLSMKGYFALRIFRGCATASELHGSVAEVAGLSEAMAMMTAVIAPRVPSIETKANG